MAKGRSTQRLVNTFPAWSKVRTDEQSLGFQLLNVSGQEMDDLHSQVDQLHNNYFISTSRVSDIDVFYRYELPGDYVFTKADNDDTDFVYTPPTVSGILNGTQYGVSIATDNDVESFWYTTTPSRLTVEETVTDDHILVDGTINYSPLPILTTAGAAHASNRLSVKISGGSSFLGLEDKNLLRKGIVQIEGLTREGLEVTEEMIFLYDETQQTFHEFQSVTASGVRVYGINDAADTSILITSANFNADDYPSNYQDLSVDDLKNNTPYFWSIASGVNASVQTLTLSEYDINDIELRVDGFTTKHPIMKQELRDTGGTNITPLDIAVEPHSNRIWAVDSTTLYVFSSDLPSPDYSALGKKNYQANCIIESESYWVTIGDTVDLDYVWVRPTNSILAHRVWVEKPDGTKKSLENDTEVTYHTDITSWVVGQPWDRFLKPKETYTLDQRGDYIFSLETKYSDETTEIDQRIVSVLYQDAVAQYDLSSLITGATIAGVDIDSEYKIWILDSLDRKHQLNKHYDKMIIDFKRKIIYFRELYDQVRVL